MKINSIYKLLIKEEKLDKFPFLLPEININLT